jgi:signal transduction histidine kinase/CheY-like chemotaxis protein
MSIRIKAVLGVALIEILLLATLIWSGIYFLFNTSEAQLLEQGRVAKRLLSTLVADPLLTSDIATIKAIIKYSRQSTQIAYIRVRDSRGHTVAQSGLELKSTMPFKPDFSLSDARRDGYFDTASDVIVSGLKIGSVELGLYLKDTEEALWGAKSWMMLIAAIEILLVGVFGVILGNYLRKNISILKTVAEIVSSGDYGVRATIRSNDEIGELTRTFNTMIETLQTHSAGLKQAHQEAHEARKLAEFESKSKSRFLAVMSHEIRTPLNGVLGALEILKEDQLSPSQRSLVDVAANSGELLFSLLSDILTYSKAASGSLTFTPSAIAIRDELRKFRNAMNLVLGRNKNELQVIVDAELPDVVEIDGPKVIQVLVNLVTNANKFVCHDKIVVSVSDTCSSNGRRCFKVIVQDRGPGIPKEKIDLIFNEFYQAGTYMNGMRDGIGLGLAISKSIVEVCGGDIGCESVMGQGSKFWFTIPFKVTSPKFGPKESMNVSRDLPREFAQMAGTILIVDDNSSNTFIIKNMLTNGKMRLVEEHDGAAAIESARNNFFDLILLDITMPGLNGIDTAERIRKLNAHYAKVPIIAITANAFAEDISSYKARGFDDVLTKPVRRDLLLKSVWINISKCVESSADISCMRIDECGIVEQNNACNEDQESITDSVARVPLFDRSIQRKLRQEIGDDNYSMALHNFYFFATNSLDRLRMFNNSREIDLMRIEAHTLKGDSATFGFPRLSVFAAYIEQYYDYHPRVVIDNVIVEMYELMFTLQLDFYANSEFA